MNGMARFVQQSEDNAPPHRFEVYDLELAADSLIDELAADVRALYIDDEFDAVLEQAARDLDTVSDPEAVAELVSSAAQSAIPAPAQRTTQPWLDTARNELGEIICYAALEELHGASVLAKRVRHKEVPHLPTRGVDAVALGDDATAPHALRLYVSETKSSSSVDSPPSVVDRTDDCLHTQLLTAVRERTKVASELARAAKYLGGAEQLRLARAMLLWGTGELATTVVPFLLRPKDRHGAQDFGAFRDAPSAFDPVHVAFCLVRIDGTIEALSQAVYEKARA
jgi:hypothetical protein